MACTGHRILLTVLMVAAKYLNGIVSREQALGGADMDPFSISPERLRDGSLTERTASRLPRRQEASETLSSRLAATVKAGDHYSPTSQKGTVVLLYRSRVRSEQSIVTEAASPETYKFVCAWNINVFAVQGLGWRRGSLRAKEGASTSRSFIACRTRQRKFKTRKRWGSSLLFKPRKDLLPLQNILKTIVRTLSGWGPLKGRRSSEQRESEISSPETLIDSSAIPSKERPRTHHAPRNFRASIRVCNENQSDDLAVTSTTANSLPPDHLGPVGSNANQRSVVRKLRTQSHRTSYSSRYYLASWSRSGGAGNAVLLVSEVGPAHRRGAKLSPRRTSLSTSEMVERDAILERARADPESREGSSFRCGSGGVGVRHWSWQPHLPRKNCNRPSSNAAHGITESALFGLKIIQGDGQHGIPPSKRSQVVARSSMITGRE
ncbi:hypothetical protein BU15DRAFT_60211 [Melanogaster broomeanus]|nr:hypothetical protein BU15DRAFT_60211 [Melanogaster broomeanus]